MQKILSLMQSYQNLVAFPTVGDGDCLFHAVFGEMVGGEFVCSDVKERREALVVALKVAEPGSRLLVLRNKGIQALISERRESSNPTIQHWQKKHKVFDDLEIERSNRLWRQFFHQHLSKHPSILALFHIGPEVLNPTLSKNSFNDLLNKDGSTLEEEIKKTPQLQKAYQQYHQDITSKAPAENFWAEVFQDPDVNNAYYDVLASPGQWMSQYELHMLAITQALSIRLFRRDEAAHHLVPVQTYNDKPENPSLSICIRNSNHFERVLSADEALALPCVALDPLTTDEDFTVQLRFHRHPHTNHPVFHAIAFLPDNQRRFFWHHQIKGLPTEMMPLKRLNFCVQSSACIIDSLSASQGEGEIVFFHSAFEQPEARSTLVEPTPPASARRSSESTWERSEREMKAIYDRKFIADTLSYRYYYNLIFEDLALDEDEKQQKETQLRKFNSTLMGLLSNTLSAFKLLSSREIERKRRLIEKGVLFIAGTLPLAKECMITLLDFLYGQDRKQQYRKVGAQFPTVADVDQFVRDLASRATYFYHAELWDPSPTQSWFSQKKAQAQDLVDQAQEKLNAALDQIISRPFQDDPLPSHWQPIMKQILADVLFWLTSNQTSKGPTEELGIRMADILFPVSGDDISFDNPSGEYSHETARALAKVCQISALTTSQLNKWLQQNNYLNIPLSPNTKCFICHHIEGHNALILLDNNRLIVAFTGPKDFSSASAALAIPKTFDPRAFFSSTDRHDKLQASFVSFWNAFQTDLLPYIQTHYSEDGFQLWFTGYSTGGVLATYAAAELKALTLLPSSSIHLYTFGQPRPGNQAFADTLLDLDCHRFVFGEDPVPYLPPQRYRFQHTGTLHHLSPHGDITTDDNPASSENQTQASLAQGALENPLNLVAHRADHYLWRYEHGLDQHVTKPVGFLADYREQIAAKSRVPDDSLPDERERRGLRDIVKSSAPKAVEEKDEDTALEDLQRELGLSTEMSLQEKLMMVGGQALRTAIEARQLDNIQKYMSFLEQQLQDLNPLISDYLQLGDCLTQSSVLLLGTPLENALKTQLVCLARKAFQFFLISLGKFNEIPGECVTTANTRKRALLLAVQDKSSEGKSKTHVTERNDLNPLEFHKALSAPIDLDRHLLRSEVRLLYMLLNNITDPSDDFKLFVTLIREIHRQNLVLNLAVEAQKLFLDSHENIVWLFETLLKNSSAPILEWNQTTADLPTLFRDSQNPMVVLVGQAISPGPGTKSLDIILAGQLEAGNLDTAIALCQVFVESSHWDHQQLGQAGLAQLQDYALSRNQDRPLPQLPRLMATCYENTEQANPEAQHQLFQRFMAYTTTQGNPLSDEEFKFACQLVPTLQLPLSRQLAIEALIKNTENGVYADEGTSRATRLSRLHAMLGTHYLAHETEGHEKAIKYLLLSLGTTLNQTALEAIHNQWFLPFLEPLYASLSQFARRLEPDEPAPEGATIFEGSFSGRWALNPEVEDTLFDFDHIRNNVTDGNRRVHRLGGDDGVHVKENPAFPGYEYAVSGFFNFLVGCGTTPSEVFKVTRPRHATALCVSISKTVPGDTLKARLDTLPENPPPGAFQDTETAIHPIQFGLAAITSLIFYSEDWSTSNLVLRVREDGAGLDPVGVDNDHFFVLEEDGEIHHPLFKNALFCLENCRQPIPQEVRDQFLSLSVDSLDLFRLMLYELQHYNNAVLNLFPDPTERDRLKRQGKFNAVRLNAYFEPGRLTRIYRNFDLVRDALASERGLTYLGLVRVVEPQVHRFYADLFPSDEHPDRSNHPGVRYNTVAGFTFTGSSRTTTDRFAEDISTEVRECHEIEDGKYSPQAAILEVEQLDEKSDRYKAIKDQLLQGQFDRFAILPPALQEHLLKKLDFAEVSMFTREQHQAFLASIASGGFKKLHIRNNPYLTEKELVGLLDQSPQLTYLDVSGCHSLTNTPFGWPGRRKTLKGVLISLSGSLVNKTDGCFFLFDRYSSHTTHQSTQPHVLEGRYGLIRGDIGSTPGSFDNNDSEEDEVDNPAAMLASEAMRWAARSTLSIRRDDRTHRGMRSTYGSFISDESERDQFEQAMRWENRSFSASSDDGPGSVEEEAAQPAPSSLDRRPFVSVYQMDITIFLETFKRLTSEDKQEASIQTVGLLLRNTTGMSVSEIIGKLSRRGMTHFYYSAFKDILTPDEVTQLLEVYRDFKVVDLSGMAFPQRLEAFYAALGRQRQLQHLSLDRIHQAHFPTGLVDIIDAKHVKATVLAENNADETQFTFKLMVIGPHYSGKSSFVRRYIENDFQEDYRGGTEISGNKKVVNMDRCELNLHIFCPPGQERYESLSKSYYMGADGFIICVSLTNINEIIAIPDYMKRINRSCRAKNPLVIFVGTKCDCDEASEENVERLRQLSEEHGKPFYITSARSAIDVDKAFEGVSKQMLDKARETEIEGFHPTGLPDYL